MLGKRKGGKEEKKRGNERETVSELASQVRLVICLAADRRVVYASAVKAISCWKRNARSVCIAQGTGSEFNHDCDLWN